MIHDLILLYHIYNAWNVDIIYYDHGLRAKVVEAVPDERPSNQKKNGGRYHSPYRKKWNTCNLVRYMM